MYNDIRNLRDYVLNKKEFFLEKKVLNLFSSNGLLSICLEKADAKLIVSLEDSRKAIAVHVSNLQNSLDSKHIFSNSNESSDIPFLSKENQFKSGKQIILKADIFKQLKSILENLNIKFDVIIIDPPSLTANDKDKVNARLTYKRLVSESIPYLKEKGSLILCSCSNRIHPNDFEKICKEAITESGRKIKTPIRLTNEIDHPTLASLPAGNYFKAHIYHDLSSV